jgi:hypothetical protein
MLWKLETKRSRLADFVDVPAHRAVEVLDALPVMHLVQDDDQVCSPP